MNGEVSAAVCCACEASRMSAENGVAAAGLAVASKAGLRGPRGTGTDGEPGPGGRCCHRDSCSWLRLT
ncbi:hypothetical protein GCM10009654_42440 [Streptomyces hebeiensis]|uniref:Uncharacterized protein n=1 Tax=Streptomyces hebeiensis TaxID=229486 RepID=A0ABN1UY44_9ACTN